jgi:predicted phosphate transport protein (TIGR00153 family)
VDITPRRLQARQDQGNIAGPGLRSSFRISFRLSIRRHMDAHGWIAPETGQIAVHLPEAEANMLGWFQALMPREERFFQLFEKHATIVVAGAEALRGLLRGGDSIEACRKEIFLREAEADEVTREVLVAVRRTFITPFDRTDIQDLITSMDDAIDQMNKTAKTIVTFEVRAFEPPMQQMSEIIVQSAQLVLEAVPLLSSIGTNASRLTALTTKLINVEEEADQVYDRGLKALFVASRDNNAMNFIVGYQLYDHLEKVVDRFEDVANEISALVIDQL